MTCVTRDEEQSLVRRSQRFLGFAERGSTSPRRHDRRKCLCWTVSLLTLAIAFFQKSNVVVSGFSYETASRLRKRPSFLSSTLRAPLSLRQTTGIHAKKPIDSQVPSLQVSLEQVLNENGYGRRLLTISSEQLPIVAEVYSHGTFELCRILALEPASKPGMPPLLQTQPIIASNNDMMEPPKTVDVGQITTIWDTVDSDTIESKWQENIQKQLEKFPISHCEDTMQRLYNSHVGRARSSGLTKKQIARIVQDAPESDKAYMEDVLRKVIKSGAGMMRLVDSAVAMDYLYSDYPKKGVDKAQRQALGASVLVKDAQLGGRFKRMPCIYVSSEMNEEDDVKSITLVNGGWLTVDQSVRAGTEARKFAARTDKTKGQLMTVADERIAHRLECLAMGEVYTWDSKGHSRGVKEESPGYDADLELDVREALKAMDLPVSPAGAQKALVQLGRWSETSTNRVKLQPWTEEVLEAARSYKNMDLERRNGLLRELSASTKAKAPERLEGRVDLTRLPCVCVDAKRTSFPDDAIGVRPRSSTGRKVVEDASKWEVLIHIIDVSDVYAPEGIVNDKELDVGLLHDAASRRGTSRYDLPLGPLHLMPPTALEALSLQVTKFDETSKAKRPNGTKKGVNRCVTLWAYIDERNGKLLDAGLERTLISAPLSLSFAGATSLLSGELESAELKQAKAVLAVAERNLNLWSEHRRRKSEAARKREDRLSAREVVAREQAGHHHRRDDGRDGFQRTRGHRVVDMALDLYGQAMTGLLRHAKAPIPLSMGSGASRGGRVGTAPLRRYIDGVVQRQALAVLCGYGGRPLTKKECVKASVKATQARNTLANVRSTKKKGVMDTDKQRNALRLLKTQLAGGNRPVPAISTGRENEVVISGLGATAKCHGVNGTLKPGDRVIVQVKKLDPERGSLSVVLVEREGR
jgi:hypothetical protein